MNSPYRTSQGILRRNIEERIFFRETGENGPKGVSKGRMRKEDIRNVGGIKMVLRKVNRKVKRTDMEN